MYTIPSLSAYSQSGSSSPFLIRHWNFSRTADTTSHTPGSSVVSSSKVPKSSRSSHRIVRAMPRARAESGFRHFSCEERVVQRIPDEEGRCVMKFVKAWKVEGVMKVKKGE